MADSQITRLAKGGTLNLAGSLAGGVSGLALVLVVTNGFSQHVAGMLFATTALFLIVTALSELGTDAGLAHAVQRALVADRPDRARFALVIALVPVVGIGLLVSIVGWLAAPWLADILLGSTESAVPMIRVLALAVPIATAYDVTLAATRAYGTMRPNVVVEKLGRLPAQILLVLLVAGFGGGPVWLVVAWTVPYVPALVVVLHELKRCAPDTPMIPVRNVPLGTEAVADAVAFWRFTAPRALGRTLQVALQRADIVLVAAMLGPRSAAIYTAVTKVVSAGQIVTNSLQQVLQPQFSRLFAAGDLANARAVFRTATAWLMALGWPIYLTAAVAAPVVLGFFGEGYESGHASVVVLTLTMLVAIACGPVDTALLMAGRSRQSLGNSVAALAADLVLIWLLVPPLGITGAAVAWAAALLVRNLLPVVQVWRAYEMFAFGPAAARVALITVACFGAVPLVVTMLGSGVEWTGVVLWLIPLSGGYAILLWLSRRELTLSAFEPVLRPLVQVPGQVGRWLTKRLPLPHRARVVLATIFLRRVRPARVPLDRLLLGSQDGLSAQRYAGAFDDLMWGSTPVTDGPHASLLASVNGHSPSDAEILASPYGEHAQRCLTLSGRYFWATDDDGIVEVARSFLGRTNGSVEAPRAGQSGPGDPILVAPIRDSDCFSVLDGHHRLALLAYQGKVHATVTVKRTSVTTPLQDLLGQMSWIGGKKELYQPLEAPELRRRWTTVRKCTDRLEKMRFFLTARGLARTSYRKPTYLDVACCYSWFVAQLDGLGFESTGLERDPLARRLGVAAYGLDPEQIRIGDASEQLRNWVSEARRWDVVSCFSLLHHFVLGRGADAAASPLGSTDASEEPAAASAEELVGLLSETTRSVLFLDMGQEHEAWFAHRLPGWNPERIKAFLLEHGDFSEIVDLGPDEDAVPPYEDNYGRHLFACVK